MKVNILLCYAGSGSSQTLLEAVSHKLSEYDYPHELREVEAVGRLSPYQALVLASDHEAGVVEAAACELLDSFQKELEHLPLWFVTCGSFPEQSTLR